MTGTGSAAPESNADVKSDRADPGVNGDVHENGIEEKPRCKLEILVTVKEAQGTNGLKHGDYKRYRQYCTRRVHRIRRATKLTQGRGRYVEKVIDESRVVKEPLALLIVLVLAERAWSAAMETKSGQVASAARGRQNILRKLKKAVVYAGRLKELCGKVAEETTALEADAYAEWMEANLRLEQGEWPKALHCFQTSSKIYESMASALAHTGATQVFHDRVEEIEPLIRFCKYNMAKTSNSAESDAILRDLAASGASGELLNEKINAALAESRKKAAQSFGEVKWCGKYIPLRSEKVREEVLKATQESETFEKIPASDITVDSYDNLFITYNDATSCVTSELGKFQSTASKEADERKEELRNLIAYLSYKKLGYTMKRNLMLVDSFAAKRSSKQEDFVRLYDNLVHNMDDMMGLEGLSDVEDMHKPLEHNKSRFLAHRCFHLAQCYAAVDKLEEATLLFDRVAYHAKLAGESEGKELSELVRQSRGLKSRARAREFLKTSKLADSVEELELEGKGKKLMIDNLNVYEPFVGPTAKNRAIADFPPRLEIVPGKPVCFDLAIDTLSFPTKRKVVEPDQNDATKAKLPDAKKKEDASGGGYLRRWFGGPS